MKKGMLLIIVVCLCLCGCKGGDNRPLNKDKATVSTSKSSSGENKAIATLQMKINSVEALMDIGDSNQYMIASMEAIKARNTKDAVAYANEALNLLIDAKTKTQNVLSSPNFIMKDIGELQKNYKKTIEIMEKSRLSKEDVEEFYSLLEVGINIHVFVLKCYQSFSNLYSIRDFDSLPDKEAEATLEETWWEFGFNDDIKCPDKVDKKELYLIWAEQYAGKKPSQSIINKIEKLRKQDDTASKEYNVKWIELVMEICNTGN